MIQTLTLKNISKQYADAKTLTNNQLRISFEAGEVLALTGQKKQLYSSKLLMFDEPFNGLNPDGSLLLIRRINQTARSHLTLVSSHA
ncbi:P-loop NTPase family protein [Brochothrix campestris]|uniref:Uncharacterized protein n=1 Tax=Brochothrix campestris FSL F6-1037 TaxID=1265861 RepID=W7CZF0_9LIST|nr:hypothetical protein [Brochothrix campestris]EUJ41141.1 hypothetical protein BCAMP_03975 [Brochothrix campestris FSL F6-1037]